MPGFSDRLGRVQVAASVQMSIRARELRARGVDVISLTLGEPNFASPPHAIEAAHQAALRGETKYPPQDGTPALKQAIQRKFKRDNGLEYALDEICVTNGGKQAIFNALMATVNPGEQSVIPVPSWSAYALMTKLADGEPVFVTCPQNNGFKPRPEDIEAAITPKTKWLILNNPNNPTGACCSAAELRAIADVMVKHPHVWIMSDDMYEHLVFDGFRHATIAQVAPELRDRTVTISGASKAYAMTGWRIGYAGGPKNLIRAMVNMQGQATAGVSTVGQAAAAAALDGPQDGVAEQIVAYRNRRDMAVEMLNACKGINCHKPEGAFYVFPNVAGCIGRTTAGGRRLETDQDVCMALLEEAHVATVHGAAYGMSPYLRVSTATDDESLAEGCRRIATFCEGLHCGHLVGIASVAPLAAMTPCLIRAGRDSDAGGFIGLIAACWSEYPGVILDVDGETPELLALASYYAGFGGALWAAEAGGQIAGMIATRPHEAGAWEICKLYVLPWLHGTGLGHRLLGEAEAHALAAGATRLVLWSDTRFDRAHRFYEKRGYVRRGPIRVLHDVSNSLEFGYAKPVCGIEVLDAAAAASAERCLTEILCACVEAGASVSYLPPLPRDVARSFWKHAASEVAAGIRILLAGWDQAELIGTVMLEFASSPNQPHRAELQKLLVHPRARRRGIARALMARVETEARRAGKTLLTLDTRAGEVAEELYRATGWQEAGRIPGYALNADHSLCDTVIFWKSFAVTGPAC